MALELITKNVWSEITKAVKASNTKSAVAVAYFGQNAASMLPLKKGSILLVDASDKAVKCGQTCPAELLKLYYQGVHVYSRENLHTKIYLIGRSLFIGSANVSGHSSKVLIEALIKTGDKQAIDDARKFIDSHCGIELGNDQLERLQKMYNPPKIGGSRNKSKQQQNSSMLRVAKLDIDAWTEEDYTQNDVGEKVANKRKVKKQRHILDKYLVGRSDGTQKGDIVIQVVNERGKVLVSPPATVVHIHNWSNGRMDKTIYYLEVPNKRRKNLETIKKQLSSEDFKSFDRNGMKNILLTNTLLNLWK